MGRRTLLLLASILVAAAGTALIWLYVQNADERAQQAWQERVTVWRAVAPIGAGVSADQLAGLVEQVRIPRADAPPDAVLQLSRLAGHSASTTVAAKAILQESQFATIGSASGVPAGSQGVSVQVQDPNRVAGLLHPGSRVAVYYLEKPGSGKGGGITVLMPEVTVVAIGNTTAVKNAQGLPAQIGTQAGVGAADVVLDVRNQAKATQLMLASSVGELWFTVLGDGTKVASDARAGMNDLPRVS